MAVLAKELSELVEVDPSRIDRVKSPANGFPVLLMKSAAKDADKKGRIDEAPDISNAEAVLRLIGELIAAEARELSAGQWDEVCDIEMLTSAAYMIKCFRNREQMSAEGDSIMKSLESAISGRATELGVNEPMTDAASKDTGVNDNTVPTDPTPTPAPVEKSTDELIAEAVAKAVEQAIEKEVKPREETIKGLEAELTALKAKPLPGGPMITAAKATSAVKPDAEELARFKRLAKEVDDRELRRYYADRVTELEASSK